MTEIKLPQLPDDTQVICPACTHQFRAIPPQVQTLLLAAGYEPPFATTTRMEAPAAEPVAELRRIHLVDGNWSKWETFNDEYWGPAAVQKMFVYATPPTGEVKPEAMRLAAEIVAALEGGYQSPYVIAMAKKNVKLLLGLATQPPEVKPAPALSDAEISLLWRRHTNEDGPHFLPYEDDGNSFARAVEAAIEEKRNAPALSAQPAEPVPGLSEAQRVNILLFTALKELHDAAVLVKATLDDVPPANRPACRNSSRLTWPLSTAKMAMREALTAIPQPQPPHQEQA